MQKVRKFSKNVICGVVKLKFRCIISKWLKVLCLSVWQSYEVAIAHHSLKCDSSDSSLIMFTGVTIHGQIVEHDTGG
jgi:hypothetical protein